MTKQILINGKLFNRDEILFLAGGRVEWKDYLDRFPAHANTGASLNEREDGSLMPWEDVPDGLTRNEEDTKMDAKFLKVVNEIEMTAKEVGTIAEVFRSAGVNGKPDAEGFARAAAQNVRNMADRILKAGGASSSGVTHIPPMFSGESEIPTTYIGGEIPTMKA